MTLINILFVEMSETHGNTEIFGKKVPKMTKMAILRPNFHQLSGGVRNFPITHFKALDKIFQIRIYSIPKFCVKLGEKWVSILLNLLKMVILSSNF